jgi:hypothetical protein
MLHNSLCSANHGGAMPSGSFLSAQKGTLLFLKAGLN